MNSAPVRIKGFTLIEVMVVVAIIAILAAIALPAYSDYVKRANLVDATNQLSAFRAQMEQYYQDARQYTSTGNYVSPCDAANGIVYKTTLSKWTFKCSVSTATAYTIEADGQGMMSPWAFTIDQSNTQATPSAATGWTTSTSSTSPPSKFCMNRACS